MGMTAVEKMLALKSGRSSVKPGDVVSPDPDFIMIHDGVVMGAKRELDSLGIIHLSSGSGMNWMDAYIWVVDHSGYALTDGQGCFVLENVPPGHYTLHVWHPGITTTTAASGQGGPPIVIGGLVKVDDDRVTEIVVKMKD